MMLQERKRQAKESEKDAKESDSKNRVALDAASKVTLSHLIFTQFNTVNHLMTASPWERERG